MPGFSERILAAPANNRLPEEKPKLRERLFGVKEEKNRHPELSYDHYLEEAKKRYKDMTLDQLEGARLSFVPEEQVSSQKTIEAIPDDTGRMDFPWEGKADSQEIKFSAIEGDCHFIAEKSTEEDAVQFVQEINEVQLEELQNEGYSLGENEGVYVVNVVGRPYQIAIDFHHRVPIGDTPPSDELVPVYEILDTKPVVDHYNENITGDFTFDDDSNKHVDRANRAESDALDFMYAKRLSEAAREGRELTAEQRMFILDNMVNMGLSSAMAELVAQQNGFTSFQQAAKELKVGSGIYSGEQLVKAPEGFFDKLPPSVQNALKSAKLGALTTGGLALIALAAPALIPTAVAAGGGLIGATLARGIVGHFKRDRAIFGPRKGEPVTREEVIEKIEELEENGDEKVQKRIKEIRESKQTEDEKSRAFVRLLRRHNEMPAHPDKVSVAEKAFRDMVEQFASAKATAEHGITAIEGAELDEADRDKAYAKLLNTVVEAKLQGTVEGIDEYRGKIKSARGAEAIASIIGGVAGGMGASYAYSHIDALRNGIQLREHTMQYIRGDWHYQLNSDDILKGMEHHQNMLELHPGMNPADTHTLTYFNGDQATGFSDLNSTLTEINTQNAFHINAENWVDGAPKILEGYYTPDVNQAIWLRSVMPGIYGASLAFLTGEWDGLTKAQRAKELQARGKTGVAAMYSNRRDVRNFNLPGLTEPVATPEAVANTAGQPNAEAAQEAQRQGQEFAHLSNEQAARIRNSIQNLVLRGQGIERDHIQRIMEGGELAYLQRECPKSITEMLGFQPGELSREDLLLLLPEALRCAVDKTTDMGRFNITDDQARRLDALHGELGQLQAVISDEQRFAPTVANVRDHILFAKKEATYSTKINRILSDDSLDRTDLMEMGGVMLWLAYRDNSLDLGAARREKQSIEESITILSMKALQFPEGSRERARLTEAVGTITTMLTMLNENHPGLVPQQNQNQGGQGRGRRRNRQNQNAEPNPDDN